jgi:hypothetical protein
LIRFVFFFLALASTAGAADQVKYCVANSRAAAVDISQNATDAFLSRMKSIGVRTIVRYYDYDPPTLPNKALRKPERDRIISNGFRLAVVFQHHNDMFSSFTPRRGEGDAYRSLELVSEDVQPKGGVIYFGVDGDWHKETDLANIRSYFQAVQNVLKPKGYRVGVYGSGSVCDDLLGKGLAEICWLANAKSWSGYNSFYASKRWRLAQSVPEDCAGINVDFNITNGKDTDFGQFGGTQ